MPELKSVQRTRLVRRSILKETTNKHITQGSLLFKVEHFIGQPVTVGDTHTRTLARNGLRRFPKY